MAKVVFLGGKSIGYGVLHTLLLHDDVVAVYTNPSDEHPTWFPSVKPLLKNYSVIYTTEDINTSETIKKLDFDWIVCAYYDRIVKKNILELPKKGSINIHMGLSDEYRGCYPTTYPIIDKKYWAGITIHQMTTGIDDGDVYMRGITSVDPTDTGKSLYYKCTGIGIDKFAQWWGYIKEGLSPRPYKAAYDTTYHTREEFPSLDLSGLTPDEAERYGRALTFPPFERPYYQVNGKKIPIYYD